MTLDQQLDQFMRDSNAIEGEFEPKAGLLQTLEKLYGPDGLQMPGRLNPADLDVAREFYQRAKRGGKVTKDWLCEMHGKLWEHVGVDWAGDYRLCNVRVGSFVAPDWKDVPGLMEEYLAALPKLDAWEAHCRFEATHPFRDGNGRMGRLLWLYKMVRAKKDPFALPFLHRFYYQALEHFEGA